MSNYRVIAAAAIVFCVVPLDSYQPVIAIGGTREFRSWGRMRRAGEKSRIDVRLI